jgi:hypothetical protein
MLLETVMKRLAHIELKNLSHVEDAVITSNARPEVITAINEALVRLYTRFPFKESSLLIEQIANYTEYKLHPKFSWSRRNVGQELHYYIMDSEFAPYTGDLIKILSVWDDNGIALPLNDISNNESLFTPYPDVLLVPRPEESQVISITYQAMPNKIGYDAVDAYEFDLPETLLSSLTAFVAHQIYAAIGTQEAITKRQLLISTFENQCAEVQKNDLLSIGVTGTGYKFHMRGFV